MTTPAKKREPLPLKGDHGIGRCLACCNEYVAGNRPFAEFAITTAPMPVPGGLLMVPACHEHLRWLQVNAKKSPIIIAGQQ